MDKEHLSKALFLVDGSGFIFRAYHALPPLTRKDGTPVGAVLGFTNMFMKLLTDYKAGAVAVIFDAARTNFRNEIYDQYKANREAPPPDLSQQIERVMEVLEEVGTADKAEAWVREALANKIRIMGFGHRVYKEGDPRARYLKSLCAELAEQTGNQDMERMADVIEGIVGTEKGLPPNLDWPSARLYHYMGLPVPLYTPLFVVSRVVGWSAHVIEQLENNRLIRPRAKYVGPGPRSWIEVGQR